MDNNNPSSTPAAGGPNIGPNLTGSTGGTGGATPAPVDNATADVKSARTAIAGLVAGTPLTKDTRKRVAKVRRKALPELAKVIDLTVDRPSLLPTGTTHQELSEKITLLAGFQGLHAETTGLNTEVDDSLLVLESDLYLAALAICNIADNSKAIDQAVVATVAEMRKALARGPKQKHKVTKVAVKTITVPVDSLGATASAPAGSPAGNGGGNTPAAPAHGTTGESQPAAPAPTGSTPSSKP